MRFLIRNYLAELVMILFSLLTLDDLCIQCETITSVNHSQERIPTQVLSHVIRFTVLIFVFFLSFKLSLVEVDYICGQYMHIQSKCSCHCLSNN